jgi:hypothetical protein
MISKLEKNFYWQFFVIDNCTCVQIFSLNGFLVWILLPNIILSFLAQLELT